MGMKGRAPTFDWDSASLARSVGVIAGKWKVKIICHLFDGTKRFSELRRLWSSLGLGSTSGSGLAQSG